MAVNRDWCDKCGFYLAVYDRTGLRLCRARYDHSQDVGQPGGVAPAPPGGRGQP